MTVDALLRSYKQPTQEEKGGLTSLVRGEFAGNSKG